MQKLLLRRPDIMIFDANDEPVVVVEVKAPTADKTAEDQLSDALRRVEVRGARSVYAMLVDTQTISLFSRQGEGLSEPLFQIATQDVLPFYDAEFTQKTIYHNYLTTLVEAWLRDCAYQWKSQTPPGYESLAAIGLTDRLRGGTTVREYSLA